MELPYDPAIPHLDIYLKKMKTLTGKDICTPMFITALFIIVKIVATLKTTKWQWMDIRSTWNHPQTTGQKESDRVPSEVRQQADKKTTEKLCPVSSAQRQSLYQCSNSLQHSYKQRFLHKSIPYKRQYHPVHGIHWEGAQVLCGRGQHHDSDRCESVYQSL